LAASGKNPFFSEKLTLVLQKKRERRKSDRFRLTGEGPDNTNMFLLSVIKEERMTWLREKGAWTLPVK